MMKDIKRKGFDNEGSLSVLSMPPAEFTRWLMREFTAELPGRIATADELNSASELMRKLTGDYQYLTNLLAITKVAVRGAKRAADSEKDTDKKTALRQEYEDMVDRQNAAEQAAKRVMQGYNAISRAMTVRQMADRELAMNQMG